MHVPDFLLLAVLVEVTPTSRMADSTYVEVSGLIPDFLLVLVSVEVSGFVLLLFAILAEARARYSWGDVFSPFREWASSFSVSALARGSL